jgi:Ca2+-binding EF-hand superfamily protein
MKPTLVKLTVAIAAAALLQACSHGGGRGGPPGGGFGPGGGGPMGGPGGGQSQARELQLRRFDADADGNIARAEFDSVLKVDFTGADKNNDGKLDGAETRALNDRLLTQREISPIIDWNADGHVTMDAFAAQWRTLFTRADADGDGTVTAEELTARARERPSGGPRGSGGGPPGQGRPGGGRPGGRE